MRFALQISIIPPAPPSFRAVLTTGNPTAFRACIPVSGTHSELLRSIFAELYYPAENCAIRPAQLCGKPNSIEATHRLQHGGTPPFKTISSRNSVAPCVLQPSNRSRPPCSQTQVCNQYRRQSSSGPACCNCCRNHVADHVVGLCLPHGPLHLRKADMNDEACLQFRCLRANIISTNLRS